MNEKYQQLYGYLSQNGFTNLSSEDFYDSYSSDKAKFNRLYAYLAENKMTNLGADDFYASYFEPPAGAKKKSQSSPSYTPPSRGYLLGDELVRQIAEAPSEPVYPNVRRAQVVRQMLENTTLLDVDQNVLQSYGLDESDWRTAQVAYALDNTEQDVRVASQAIQDRSYEQALAEAKAKAQEAFIPQLLKDTFPNSPNLFRAAEWLFEPQYGPMGNSTANFMLDLIDSSVRAVAGGLTTNDAATEAFNVFNEKGAGLSRESTDRLYNAVVAAQGFQERYGQSESMLEWSAEIEEAKRNGDSELLAALFATAKNPMVLPEIMVNSYASVFNKASIAAAATTTGGFIAGGAGAGAVGGPAGAAGGALVGAASSVPWAMGAAFTALEVGMTFPELVRAEMEERGMEFNKENFYAALNNDEIYNSALARSAARGAAIGVVSALGARAATQVSKNLANRGMSSVGRTFSVAPIEMGAGFSGEVLGQAAGGQEIDLAEATMEGLAEIGMAPIAVAGAYAEDLAAKKPKYKVGTNTVGREEIERVVTAATPEELKQMSLTVENDSEMEALIDDKMFRSEIADRVPETLDSEARRRIINLEAEKRQIQNRKTDSFTGTEGAMAIAGKERIAQIDEEIYDIMNSAPAPEPLQPITLNIEPAPEPEIVVEPTPTLEPVFVADLVNRPVTLTSHNGTPLETPVQGDLYVDGQTVVVESADRIYEIGNVSELSEQDSRALGIEPQVETVVVQADESLVIENEEFLIQRDLPTMGIDYDADGNVTRVSLESKKDGSKKMFSGQTAIDAAYQILLSKAESPEQIDRVDQILEQDEEYKRLHDEYVAKKLEEREDKPREVAAAPQARPDTDTRPSAKPSESKPVAKPEPKRTSPLKEKEAPQPKPANKVVDRLTRLLSIETDPVRMSSLVAQLEQAEAMGVALPEKSAKELREAKEQLEAGGYVSETPQVGSDYDPNTTDEVVMVTSTELPAGQKKVVSVTRPRVTQNGRVKQPAKLVVAVGTADPTALSTGRARGELQTLSNPRTQKQLQTTYEKLWGMTPEKAKAAAAISDKMIGAMAARHGISKKDMYARIKWVKSSSVDANGNSVPGTDGPVVRFQSRIEDSKRGITMEFFAGGPELEQRKQSGNLDDNAPLSTIYDKSGVLLHTPDKAGGFIISKDGKNIVEGQGGMYFPLLPGFFENRYFWASTEGAANGMADSLNRAAQMSKDGKVRMVLVSTNLNKLSGGSGINQGLVRMLQAFMEDKKFPLLQSDVKSILIAANAALGSRPAGKPDGPRAVLNADVKGSMNVKQIIDVILDKLSPESSSFADRWAFFDGVAGALSKVASEDPKKKKAIVELLNTISGLEEWSPSKNPKQKLFKKDVLVALHSAFSEPILRNVGNSLDTDTKLGTNNERVYAVIEADVNPDDPANTFEAVSPKKEGLPEHASYPRVIRLVNQDARTTVRILNERAPWYNLVINPQTGRTPEENERLKLFPYGFTRSPLSTTSISEDPTDVNLIPLTSSAIDTEAVTKNTKAEVDRIKGLPENEEDGATFNNDGTKLELAQGAIVPVASFNTTQEELTPEMISEFLDSMKGVFSTQTVRFGLYKFPDSTKVSIDINIVVDENNRDEAIKFARYAGQKSVFFMSDFSTVETGASGKNPKTFSIEQYAEIARRLEDGTIDTFIQDNNPYSLPEEISDVLTDDGNGNYVFRHYSEARRDVIKPGSGENIRTSRDEAAAIGSVGGLAMYYVDDSRDVGGQVPHIVKVPKDKVYYYNEDALNLWSEAKKRYSEKTKLMNFLNYNQELAWVTKVANERGFEMVISEWSVGNAKLRAQTTMTLEPIEGDFKMNSNKRTPPNIVKGDNILIDGYRYVVVDSQIVNGRREIEYTNTSLSNTQKQFVDLMVDGNGNPNVTRSRFIYDVIDSNGNVVRQNKGQVYFQDQRAAIVMRGTEAVIHAISNPDVTSPLHELAHLYEQVLTDEERQQILDWTGQEQWNGDTSEAFAEGFEKFLYEGEAPTPEMKSAFSKFKKWITEIYSAIKGTPLQLELNDNMRRIYENIFATQEPENITHNQQPINGVLYQGPTNAQGQSTYSPSNMSSFQTYLLAFRRKWQDKYAEVMWFQDDIKKQGKKVTESADFRMAEDLMHGRTRNDMDKVEQQLDEAQKFMRKHGITSDDLSDYLYALHAPSRNQSILDKYGKVDGSGMSDAEADAILNDLRAKYDPDILEQAADYFRNMLANNRQVMFEFGLETADILDDFEQNETYVPLFGIATDEMSTDTTVYPTGGAGIHVYGHVSKKAKGRKSRATNVLANIVSASLALRIKARKNESLLSLYNLIQDNPSDAWEVVSDSDTGDEASVGVRINGEQHFIRFADPNKAKQLKNMGIDSVNWFNKALRVLPTSWLRKSYTVYDPDFVMSNFWRDIEAAILNAAAEAEEGGITEGVDLSNDMAKVKKNVWPTFKALLKINFGGNADPAINQYYEEMKEDGGITGWVQLKTLGDMAADIQSGIDPSGLRISKDKLGAVFTYVEKINDSVEQAIRLTAYIVARERGISRNKAAQLAKNITVNFNRYGEHGITLNQFKMFFNASIQGSYRILTTLGKTRKGTGPFYTRLTKSQKLAFGLFLMNSTVTAFNIAMSDDDEDDVSFYKKMSDNDKQRNMILMYDGKHSIKIPVTFGYSAITSFAEAVTSTAMGVRDADDACWFTLSSLLNSFSPVQFGDYTTIEKSIATLITPSGLAAVTESALNETFMGSQVYREQLPFGTPAPEYQLGFKSPMWLRDATKAINEMTGGSEYVPGDIDINPDRIYHYYNFYIGGLGRFVGRSGEAILSTKEMIQSGRTVRMSANDLPLLRKMYGEPSRFYDYRLFTENLTESKQLLDEYEDPATRSSDKDRYGKIYTIKQARLATEKKLKDLRAQLRQAEKIEDYVERKNTVFELYEKQRLIMAEFNKLYNEKGPKKD